MYLVAECMTMSAPSSSGRVSTGVANVLSTPSSTPRRLAIAATAAMSVIDICGLPGLSIQSSFVLRRDRRFERRQVGAVGQRHA